MFSKQFVKRNSTVETADHGEHALEVFNSKNDINFYQIIFTDGNMPPGMVSLSISYIIFQSSVILSFFAVLFVYL